MHDEVTLVYRIFLFPLTILICQIIYPLSASIKGMNSILGHTPHMTNLVDVKEEKPEATSWIRAK